MVNESTERNGIEKKRKIDTRLRRKLNERDNETGRG